MQNTMFVRYVAVLIPVLALGACTPEPAPPSSPNSGTTENIRGNERLGWNQQAASTAELGTFRYAIYVDGNRSEMSDTSCAAPAGAAGFACSGRLPSMAPGTHTLELGTFVMSAGAVVESQRSAPLVVNVTGVTTDADSAGRTALPRGDREDTPAAATGSELTTHDGIRLGLDTLAEGFSDATDLTFAPDGRLLVAERRGRIITVRDGRIEAVALLLDEVTTPGGRGGLLAVTLDPDFERNRFLYALHTASAGDHESEFRIIRLREAGGIFGERAVLMNGVPASSDDPAGSLRFGPDGKLYAAFDDGGNPYDADRTASASGKILRLNADGSTPADQPSSNPVRSSGHHSPRGFDWQPRTGALWITDAAGDRTERLIAVGRDQHDAAGGAREAVHALPAGLGASAAMFYRGLLIPAFADDLLVASAEGLLRVRFDAQNPLQITTTERLLEREAVQAVAMGPDGAVYLSTGSAVLRLAPGSREGAAGRP